jgi:hypothetical protein
MKILEYNDIDYTKVRRQYEKVTGYLERDDFRSAAVKKLAEFDLYSARLDDANRLIFKLVQYRGARYALMLEVVLNHAYDRSKFLRGARIDETKIPPLEDLTQVRNDSLPSVVYINPTERRFHFLEKVVSFDPEQSTIYRAICPLIIIGPAGSGKTIVTLEKLKLFRGEGLYVTHSEYLAERARVLYSSHHYENSEQEVSFLSFREYLETMRVPQGKEVSFSRFAEWLYRFPKQQRVADAHRLYEEFRGVITGAAPEAPYLGREEYLALGVRQSIYLGTERHLVYDLFEKYLVFLKESCLYDPNILAHSYLNEVKPLYDFVVVDEVQDITNVQLQLILKSLKNPREFVLCGDSNQIVHPNFFSWSRLKSMLLNSAELETTKVTRILQANFRNSRAVTTLANRIIRIKQQRFGSVDKESTYLMESLSENTGEVLLLKDTQKVKSELNKNIRRSTKFAVIVMRSEDKASARKWFDTPLLFTVQEAKGLEYANVILLNFVSEERQSFQEIVRGVSEADMERDIRFMRAADKTDKSLEVYKFFINSLYVAVTRAVERLYIIESDAAHPLLGLMGLRQAVEEFALKAEQSSTEEWQAEARKLELQGKQEQAELIRQSILKMQAVPWEVFTPTKVIELADQIRQAKDNPQRPRKLLFEYALFYDAPAIIAFLSGQNYAKARQIYSQRDDEVLFNFSLYDQQRANFLAHLLPKYTNSLYREVLKQCAIYGVDYRNEYNATPLMLAAKTGVVPLIKELLLGGANADLTDNFGFTAWQNSLHQALRGRGVDSATVYQVHKLLAPASVSLHVDDKLVKLSSSQGEFLLFQVAFVLLPARITNPAYADDALTAAFLAEAMAVLPDSVIDPYRKKHTYISGLLAKHEVDSQNPYNRKLFQRVKRGHYIINPRLKLRSQDDWRPVLRALGLDSLRRMFGPGEQQ